MPPHRQAGQTVFLCLIEGEEADHAVGFSDATKDLIIVILLLVLDVVEDVLGYFLNRLDELRRAGLRFFTSSMN